MLMMRDDGMTQLPLPFDFEPCMNHEARLMADEMVETGEILNWDHAYECAWNFLEVENERTQSL